MKTHNLVQNTPEWHQVRAKHFTASEAPALIGVSPYMNRTELLTLKKTGVAKEVDEFTQRRFDQGHAVEEKARAFAEEIIGEELYPITGSVNLEGLDLLASFDGLTMMQDIAWEHKLLNEKLDESLAQGIIPDQYKPQLEQQLLISGADKTLFMASDGTTERMRYAWYKSDPTLRDQLIASWKQFQDDLKTFEPPQSEVTHETERMEDLPALIVKVSGEITSSNLDIFKQTALDKINSINTDLATDADFAQAEEDIKFCKKGEKSLSTAKESVLSQTATIDELFKTVDYLSEELRQKRLYLDKLVKTKKTEIKNEIIKKANDDLSNLVLEINSKIKPAYLPNINADFAGAIKGKRSISSIQDAVNTELANAKIKANELFMQISGNLEVINDLAADYKFLFNDLDQIINHPTDIFESLVKARIVEHKEAERAKEEARKKAEQERIEAEKKRIEAEAERKLELERERIRQEEAKKAQEAEQARIKKEAIADLKSKENHELKAVLKEAIDRDVVQTHNSNEDNVSPREGVWKWLFSYIKENNATDAALSDIEKGIAPYLTINYKGK